MYKVYGEAIIHALSMETAQSTKQAQCPKKREPLRMANVNTQRVEGQDTDSLRWDFI